MLKFETRKRAQFSILKFRCSKSHNLCSNNTFFFKSFCHFNNFFGVQLMPNFTYLNVATRIMPVLRNYKHLLVSTRSHLQIIQFNRPTKKNAINPEVYHELISALNDAAVDDKVVITALTGAGDFYSSGNDLSSFASASGDMEEEVKKASCLLKKFVEAFIDFPKILAAAVNGPAIGIAVTTLGLCDIVYASDKATFHTPFSSLGLVAEGCSTYTFPRIMGYNKACEMLYFNKKISAVEGQDCKLVSEVFPHDTFLDTVMTKLEHLSNLPCKSLMYSKALVRNIEREALHKALAAELEQLEERWQSEDCLNAVIEFMQRKSKL